MSTATHNANAPATANSNPNTEARLKEAVHSIAANWGWLAAAGALSALAGVIAISAPAMATGVTALVLAAAIMAAGCVNLTGLFFAESNSDKAGSALVGVAQILFGVVMLVYPLATVVSLTIVVASFMLVAGLVRVGWAIATRGLPGWGWSLAGGLATATVGVIALTGMPGAALWLIGLLVGCEMLTTGIARIAAALELRRVAKETA